MFDKDIIMILATHAPKALYHAVYQHYNKGDVIGYIRQGTYVVEPSDTVGTITHKQALSIIKCLNKHYYDYNAITCLYYHYYYQFLTK